MNADVLLVTAIIECALLATMHLRHSLRRSYSFGRLTALMA